MDSLSPSESKASERNAFTKHRAKLMYPRSLPMAPNSAPCEMEAV